MLGPRRWAVFAWTMCGLLLPAPALPQSSPVLNELRIDQPGTDPDEYFEIAGPPLTSLDGLTFIAIGDSGAAGDSGTIEVVVSLAGASVPADGFFLVSEATQTLAIPDLTASLNFENGDTVTYMLVAGFTGALNQDLDTNDDGVLEVQPWMQVVDAVANLAPVSDHSYAATTVGPGPLGVAWHIRRCGDGTGEWTIGPDDPATGTDTPGVGNGCLGDVIFADGFEGAPPVVTVNDIQTGAVSGSVSLDNVVITARSANGRHLWVADAAAAASYGGIYVFRGAAAPMLGPEFTIGATVEVTGTATEFDGSPPGDTLTEVDASTITLLSQTGPSPSPLLGIQAATVSSIADGEPYEGVLVQLSNLKVTGVTTGDRVTLVDNNGATILMDDDAYNYVNPSLGTCFSSVTGVTTLDSFANVRLLLPRMGSDLNPGGTCN